MHSGTTRASTLGFDGEADRALALDAAAAGISVVPEPSRSLDQAQANTLLLRDLRHLLRVVAARRSAVAGRTVRPLDVLSELVDRFRGELEAEAGMPRPRAEG